MKKKRISILTVLLAVCAATMAQGLKDAYKDYFLIGVAVNQRNVTNAEQQALIKREFSSMTAESVKALNAAGQKAVGYISPNTGHEFLTWRRSLKELAPLLFK